MEVYVKMDIQDFEEFKDWREEQNLYQKRLRELHRELAGSRQRLASAVLGSIKPKDDTMKVFEIVEQGQMSDAWELARDMFA